MPDKIENFEMQLNDQDMMKKKEDEHLRLQRQFRIMQRDRTHRTEGVHPMLRRQDLLLRALTKEYSNMNIDVKLATTGCHKLNDKRIKEQLERSLLLRCKTLKECEERLNLMDQLEGLLQRNHKNLLELQSRVCASMGELKERAQQGDLRLVATENKLETANRRFNAVQYENKLIREQIEHMLKDRTTFNQSWTKMIASLGKGKKFLTDLFESSAVAYDQRDEWCTKLKSVVEKGRVEQNMQVQEMRNLQKAFDREMKTYKFLAAKGVIRVNQEAEEKNERLEQEREEELEAQVEHHSSLLKEIYDYADEENSHLIADMFDRTEHENFGVYRLTTEFCAENIRLGKDLARIRREIEDRREFNESLVDREREKLDHIKQELEEVTSRTEELRNQVQDKNKLLETNMEKIGEIFRMLDLSLEPFQNLLGDKHPTINHLGLTTCLISEKTQELIEDVYYLEHVTNKKTPQALKGASRLKKFTVSQPEPQELVPLPINVLVPADPCPACTEGRWMTRITESLEVPLSRNGALRALRMLNSEQAYERSDRVHLLQDCRLPASRLVLAKRYM